MPRPTHRLTPKQNATRAAWLLVLFVVAGSLSYPAPANWALSKLSSVAGFNLGQIKTPFVLGLDLQGGTHLEYEADLSRVSASDRTESLSGVRDVIERRVNAMGVSEPLIQTTQAGNSWRVTVELAGVRDVNQAIKMIGETPILAFKEVNDVKPRDLTPDEQKELLQKNQAADVKAEFVLKQALAKDADFAALAKANSEIPTFKDQGGDAGFLSGKAGYEDVMKYLGDVPVGSVAPRVMELKDKFVIAKVEETKDIGEEVKAAHILISYKGAQTDVSQLTKEQAKAKIEEIKAKATPANFTQLAKQYSQEPNAATSGGELGWFGKGEMVDAFEKAVFPMATGTISDVVESPFGYHLIWKEATRTKKDVHARLIEFKRFTETDIVPAADPWKDTELTGKQLQSARVDFDQRSGRIQVALQFNSEGATLFADITKRNVGKQVAIFLDGQPISTPVVQTEIVGGQAVISGNFSVEEAKLLARRLNAGALPVPIKLIAQQTVGPTLGADSLARSLRAGLIGFILVAIFMVLLYRIPGILSIVALLLYAALSAAVFKLIPVTMTLAGIAGFILSLGIAVDANVLAFERLKEEWREGKPMAQALEDAFRRAWPSIRDGHVTVLISCAVLYWFSSSIIRGFALTLAVGTVLSLFTAVVSTRTLLRFVSNTPLARLGWFFLKPRERKQD